MLMIISYILCRKTGIHNSKKIIKGENKNTFSKKSVGNFVKGRKLDLARTIQQRGTCGESAKHRF